ncbi:IPExxxVDY family protein [uncultured Acetobacteroides sp.]|uniref:IPExxxVDY family protein n=1 Tax=uncultured Acetobacteroides sp. TaxID=1760811 RepID=UPI0029F4DA52|nr:IPExxxVDY family protein [uncultured Acetobacteroides sp.]
MRARKLPVKPLQKVKLADLPSSTLILFAICSTENGYRLSWLLNSILSLNLQRHELNSNEFPDFICKFDAFTEEKNNGAILLPNKIDPTSFIAPKYKEFDFLLAIRQNSDVLSLESAIKKTSGVVAAVQITNLNKMILDLVNLF